MLFLSIWILLIWRPSFLFQASFLLSYLAVFAIFYVYPLLYDCSLILFQKKYGKKYYKLSSFLSFSLFTLAIQITSLGMTLYFFGSLFCLSFFMNLLLLPLGTFFILWSFLSFFLEIFHLGFMSLFLLEKAYLLFLDFLSILSKIPYMTLYFETKISLVSLGIFYLLLFLFCFALKSYLHNSSKTLIDKFSS